MIQYEYTTAVVEINGEPDENMNKLGREGWYVCHAEVDFNYTGLHGGKMMHILMVRPLNKTVGWTKVGDNNWTSI